MIFLCIGIFCGCSSAGDKPITANSETPDASASESNIIDFDAYFDGVEIGEDSRIYINGSILTTPIIESDSIKPEDVKSLSFWNVTISSLEFVQNYESLQAIEIVDCIISENSILPEIKSLDSITIGFLDSVSIDTGNLKSLDIIQNNNQISNLHCLYFDIETLSALSSFSNLTKLDLWGNKASTPLDYLEPLSNLPNLQKISFLDGNYTLESIKPLYNLPQLIEIEMNILTFNNLPKDERDYFEEIIVFD